MIEKGLAEGLEMNKRIASHTLSPIQATKSLFYKLHCGKES